MKIDSSTNITAGLKKGLELLTSLDNDKEAIHYLRPVVLLFTDGGHNTGCFPYKTADKIKEIADLVTVAFGQDADTKLLKKLASTEQHFYRCDSGKDLRQFMASVGKTMTMTYADNQNTTDQLTQLQ